jgi:hypothetical protein
MERGCQRRPVNGQQDRLPGVRFLVRRHRHASVVVREDRDLTLTEGADNR